MITSMITRQTCSIEQSQRWKMGIVLKFNVISRSRHPWCSLSLGCFLKYWKWSSIVPNFVALGCKQREWATFEVETLYLWPLIVTFHCLLRSMTFSLVFMLAPQAGKHKMVRNVFLTYFPIRTYQMCPNSSQEIEIPQNWAWPPRPCVLSLTWFFKMTNDA